MILRAIEPSLPPRPSTPVPIWEAVEKHQRISGSEFWLITQPAHAALSGEMAAQFDPVLFPGLDANVVSAISLHDAGWGPYDAYVIQPLASVSGKGKPQARPYSFISAPLPETLAAWTGSIDTAAKLSPLGGLLVSLHFCSIATMKPDLSPQDERAMQHFLKKESARQQAWHKKLGAEGEEARVQPLLKVLQLCDLLSLYLCCGLKEAVDFPQQIGASPVRLRWSEAGVKLEPSPFLGEHLFSISALRYPRLKDEPRGASFSLVMS